MNSTVSTLTMADLEAAIKAMPPIPARAVCGLVAYRMIQKVPRLLDPLPEIFGMRLIADATLPDYVVELRDRDDRVIARHVLTG